MHRYSPIPRPGMLAAHSGMAPLEFVMALPVLLLLIVGITWLGFSIIGQTEVLVEARHKAWKRRFEDASKKPLVFSATPLYSADSDHVTERASKSVDVSPMFSRLPAPESSHTILAGSWDYRAMPLNGPPNWKLHMVAVSNAKTAGLQTALGNLENIDNVLGDMARQAIADVARSALPGGGGSASSIEDLGSGVDAQTPDTTGEQDEQRDNRDEERRQLVTERDRLNQQISQAEKELQALFELMPRQEETPEDEADPPQSDTDPAEDQETQQSAAVRRAQQIELAQAKLKRLNMDLSDINAELSAID